jgi:RecJ-like exonuclease
MIAYSTCPTCHQQVCTTECDNCGAVITEGAPSLVATVYRTDTTTARPAWVLCANCMVLPLAGTALSESAAPATAPPTS